MEILSMQFLTALVSLIIIDLVLAGDNAVVIAMASHNLPHEHRNKAIYVGTAGAILIRVLMTLIAVELLKIPFLQVIGGVILIPIAYKLLLPAKEEKNIDASSDFWTAVKTIIVADAAMGIDNVLAVAGAANGSDLLVILGLMISVPIVVGGSQIIGKAMDKWPVLIYLGSGILAWTAGSMVIHDKAAGPVLLSVLGTYGVYVIPVLIIAAVCSLGWKKRNR